MTVNIGNPAGDGYFKLKSNLYAHCVLYTARNSLDLQIGDVTAKDSTEVYSYESGLKLSDSRQLFNYKRIS